MAKALKIDPEDQLVSLVDFHAPTDKTKTYPAFYQMSGVGRSSAEFGP